MGGRFATIICGGFDHNAQLVKKIVWPDCAENDFVAAKRQCLCGVPSGPGSGRRKQQHIELDQFCSQRSKSSKKAGG